MKLRYIIISILAFIALICLAATADKGLPISQYPNNGFPNSNALFVMARPGVTNENISFGQLAFRITNGLSAGGGSGISRIEVQTNGTRVGLVTNLNWTYGVTGSVSSSTARLGVDDSSANTIVSNGAVGFTLTTSNFLHTADITTSNGVVTLINNTSNTIVTTFIPTTNFLNLSVQAAKLPTTNYPRIDAGWQGWETVYYETNFEGARANLEATWQLMVPPDYVTNSMQLLINYSLLNTNGPNASNVIFGVSFVPVRSGTTNNVHTNTFGFTAWGTNEWIAKYDGTNIVTNLVVSLGTNAALRAFDLGIMKVTRDAVNDTYGGSVSVHGLQLIYTR